MIRNIILNFVKHLKLAISMVCVYFLGNIDANLNSEIWEAVTIFKDSMIHD